MIELKRKSGSAALSLAFQNDFLNLILIAVSECILRSPINIFIKQTLSEGCCPLRYSIYHPHHYPNSECVYNDYYVAGNAWDS